MFSGKVRIGPVEWNGLNRGKGCENDQLNFSLSYFTVLLQKCFVMLPSCKQLITFNVIEVVDPDIFQGSNPRQRDEINTTVYLGCSVTDCERDASSLDLIPTDQTNMRPWKTTVCKLSEIFKYSIPFLI